MLFLIDDDETFRLLGLDMYYEDVRITHNGVVEYLYDDSVIFPADELTRQRGVSESICNWFNKVHKEFYDKRFVSMMLESKGVSVPKTFGAENVILKPNSMSAGSKGVFNLDDFCVQQRINIAHEYVVDMFVDQDGHVVQLFPREVKLRAGYDKYIRFLNDEHKVAQFAKDVVAADSLGIFRGPCHIQVIEDECGILYFIEGSKRISGSSLVNILRGYDPFALLNGIKTEVCQYDEEWHLFDELLIKVEEVLK